MSLAFAVPTEWWLEIPPDEQTKCWQSSQTLAGPRRNQEFYLNQLCIHSFLPWFQQHYAPEAREWPNQDGLLPIWNLVNGSCVLVGARRIVLVPVDTLDSDGLDVPQEWVDIPTWAAHYYLAVQMDLEERWLRVWGYTTHRSLKQTATYDPMDRTYCLPTQKLSRDLNVFWTIVQGDPGKEPQPVIGQLPVLSPAQASSLLEQVNQTMFPRLSLPFEEWGALLSSDTWRQSIAQRPLDNAETAMTTGVTVLGNWFQGSFDTGWQSVDMFLGQGPTLAFRNSGAIGNTNDSGLERMKFITLNSESESQGLALILALKAEADGRMGVRVQVYSNYETPYVPPHLVLAIYSDRNEVLQSIQARNQEDSIRLPAFKCSSGTTFRLQLSLNDETFSETFTV
ncbi:MAG: DUF1822 family protein [Leptolyngbya sp. SIO3F4]|nr:DUF1822 family protein [Leptolyngbya sp. SIO3F4]